MSLSLRIQPDDGAARLTATGEIDVRTGQLVREGVDRAVRAGARTVRLDLTGVTFIDSAGLGVLLGRHKALAATGARLVLVGPGPHVRRLLAVTGLDAVLVVEEAPPAPEEPADARPGAPAGARSGRRARTR